ncbi:hypothetical protein CASFOL_020126 [Castilleja foliolosa]|uniref:Uncharacterized protein n=1 Tax=Castilleja foliolosa TaxID=1961234 RepID=A0ABD3D195_9LAMI
MKIAAVEERARAAREAAGDDNIDMIEIYYQVVPVVKQRLLGRWLKAANFVNLDSTAGPAVCTAFMKKAATRYRDMITRFKKARSEVKDKSEKASRNRKGEKAGPGTGLSRHSGGSHSAYANDLALEIGCAPDAYVHTRKDGTFIDEQARMIKAAAVEDRARAAREAAGDGDIDMTEIYCQVVPVVKQRLFGTGSIAADFVNSNCSPPLQLTRRW